MTTTKRASVAQAQPRRGLPSFSDNQYSVARVFPSGHRIWPGPECIDTDGTRRKAKWCALVIAGADMDDALDRVRREDAERREREATRTRGIALAHERARARMARFVAWLGRWGGGEATAFREIATAAASPEAGVRAVAARAPGAMRWFALACDAVTIRQYVDFSFAYRRGSQTLMAAATDALVASPEWLSLPWQREPAEVIHG